MTDEKFFELTRAQIQHEDGLLNNRLTWLLTLQGFLFGAYGFSLSAAATALNADDPSAVLSDIDHARTGLAMMGFVSAALLVVGINDLVTAWLRRGEEAVKSHPQIIGTAFGSIHLGLLPTYLLPVTCAAIWLWIKPLTIEYLSAFLLLISFIVGLAYLLALAIDRNRQAKMIEKK